LHPLESVVVVGGHTGGLMSTSRSRNW
jgi:hypothetical protein